MTINPFDIKSALLAKHAQHVVLIHFPIALFFAAVAFDYAAQWTRNRTKYQTKSRTLAAAAYFNLLLAAISTVPVVASGIAAWQWALEGQKLKGILRMHLVLGCVSSVLIWLVFWIHWRARRRAEEFSPDKSSGKLSPLDVASPNYLPSYRLPLEAFAVLIVILTGHLGGFLSGVNLPG
jgi:uncharacterized membrane protein